MSQPKIQGFTNLSALVDPEIDFFSLYCKTVCHKVFSFTPFNHLPVLELAEPLESGEK